MRVKNIKVSCTYEIPVNEPDGNNIIYTEEVIANAYSDIKNKPIITYDKDGNPVVIGVITDGSYSNGTVSIDGYLYAGGTDESRVNISQGIVNSFEINAIGFDK